MHGGVPLKELTQANPEAVIRGLPNLERHMESIDHFGVPLVVCINRFSSDTDAEVQAILDRCGELGYACEVAEVWRHGGQGALNAAQKILDKVDNFQGEFTPLYGLDDPVKDKIGTIARKIYGADGVEFTRKAELDLRRIDRLGLSGLPICMAKTQKSLSDDPKKLGRPENFSITVREIPISSGAGFLVPITGSILRMPGLGKIPAAVNIDIDAAGTITGLF